MINNKKHVTSLLKKSIQKHGYSLVNIRNTGRSYLGKAKKGNKSYFVKIAKSKKESLFLQNGVFFNKGIEKLKPPFSIPTVVYTDVLLKDFYFKIETEILGTPYAVLKKGISEIQVKKPKQCFPKIIDMIFWLQGQKINLPLNIAKPPGGLNKMNNQKTIETMIRWGFNSTPRLSDLLKIVLDNKSVFKNTTSHRDITPINIIITKQNKIGLVDADIAKKAPKHYDVAEFYNRLWTRVCKPELAKDFLKTTISKLRGNKEYFFNQFLTISAFRAVGNYWEVIQIKNSQDKRIKYLTSYANHIADKEFLKQ